MDGLCYYVDELGGQCYSENEVDKLDEEDGWDVVVLQYMDSWLDQFVASRA